MKKIQKTKWHSYKTGNLCEGCKQCVRGEKLVLFVTGLCPRKCEYCPISNEKYGNDEVYANEWKIKNPTNAEELYEEAKMTGAKGAGITGGDPLARLDRTTKYIKELKKRFGKNFHIHLYTSLSLVSEENLKKLNDAGLDEIRFHPEIGNDKLWSKILLAKKYEWKIGVEIPVIPKKISQTKKLIKYLKDKIDFLNLNELELSDTDTKHYNLDKYERKNNVSYAVKGSEGSAMKLLTYCAELKIDTHYCTAKLKNRVQVGERLKRRAENTKRDIDELTEEYLLYRGALYLKGYEPSFNYKQGLNQKINKKALELAKINLLETKKFKEVQLIIDEERNRILTRHELARKYKKLIKEKNLVPTIVEEYPSSDYFCVELEFL